MMVASSYSSLLLVGAGEMGFALLRGWLTAANPDPSMKITVVDRSPSEDLHALCASSPRVSLNPSSIPPVFDALVLAVKPWQIQEAAASLTHVVSSETLIISLAAGIKIATLQALFPQCRHFVRTMPNLAAWVKKSITALYAHPREGDHVSFAENLFLSVGKVLHLSEEAPFEAITAISGSGPAYVFYLVECLAGAAIKAGLPKELGDYLSLQTLISAAALLERSPCSAQELREKVTSPKGTTEAAMKALSDQHIFAERLEKAVEAACQRAEELSASLHHVK